MRRVLRRLAALGCLCPIVTSFAFVMTAAFLVPSRHDPSRAFGALLYGAVFILLPLFTVLSIAVSWPIHRLVRPTTSTRRSAFLWIHAVVGALLLIVLTWRQPLGARLGWCVVGAITGLALGASVDAFLSPAPTHKEAEPVRLEGALELPISWMWQRTPR